MTPFAPTHRLKRDVFAHNLFRVIPAGTPVRVDTAAFREVGGATDGRELCTLKDGRMAMLWADALHPIAPGGGEGEG